MLSNCFVRIRRVDRLKAELYGTFRFYSSHNSVVRHKKIDADINLYQKVVYTAFQPTGCLHIGNYFGAVATLLNLQTEVNVPIFINIADLHSLTEWRSSSTLKHNIFDLTAGLLAFGISPERCTIFQQSGVSEQAELAWMLGCLTTLPQLTRQTHYKSKSSPYQNSGAVPLGLLTYPVLQAADIMLYKATHVPVGEDQSQHLELCRMIARSFNNRTGRDKPGLICIGRVFDISETECGLF